MWERLDENTDFRAEIWLQDPTLQIRSVQLDKLFIPSQTCRLVLELKLPLFPQKESLLLFVFITS